MMLMQLENGVQASYMHCHYSPDSCRNYTIIGDAGRIENIGDWGECQVNIYTSRELDRASPTGVKNEVPHE